MADGPSDSGRFLLPAGTVALLLADVEGSTRLWEGDEGAAASATARHDEIVAEIVGRHNGVRPLDQGEGDSFLAAFARPSDAVACALDLQRSLLEAGLSVRMAVHTGEVQIRDERNYVGITINRCARVRDAAHGGQVILTRPTYDLVADRLPAGASVRDLGPHRFRDLRRAEHIYQLCHPDVPDDFPTIRSLEARRHNLPVQLTRFVGRGAELAELRRLLADNRLVSIVGSGGAGKTRVALQAAAELLDAHPDGTWFADLADTTDPTIVSAAVARAMGVHDESAAGIERVIGDGTVLLIFDNCEQVLDGCAPVADALLRACPDLRILATSRQPLDVAGETLWHIPPLALPPEHGQQPIAALAASEAVELFVDRARRARHNFALTDENASAVVRICTRLDGIPLAIELAAARVRTLTVERIAVGLDDRFHLLGAGPRTAVPRHQTLRASIDWSHSLLSDEESAVFRRLAVFAGGFSLEAAEVVCSADDVVQEDVLDILGRLVDRSLVLMDDNRGEPRYRMLETIRSYATESLTEAEELDPTVARHRDFFVAFVERAGTGLEGPDQNVWTARLIRELDNLRAARRFSVASGDVQAMATISVYVWRFGDRYGSWDEWMSWIDESAAFEQQLPPPLRLSALLCASAAAHSRGRYAEALMLADRTEALAADLADVRATVWTLHNRAAAIWMTEGPDKASKILQSAVAIARVECDAVDLAHILRASGGLNRLGGNPDLAAEQILEAKAIFEERGNARGVRTCNFMLADLAFRAGQLDEARSMLEAALEAAIDAQAYADQIRILSALQLLLLSQGEFAAARHIAQDADGLIRRVGALEAFGPLVLGRQAAYEGDLEAARALILDGLAAARAIDVRTMLHGWIARIDVVRNDLGHARTHADSAIGLMEIPRVSRFLGFAQQAAARVARAEGRLEHAEEICSEALGVCLSSGHLAHAAAILELLGGIIVEQGGVDQGVRLLAAGRSWQSRLGYRSFPFEAEQFDSDVEAARAAMDPAAFAKAWEEGYALALEEAVAYASRGRGERKRPSYGWASLTPMETEVVALVAQGLTNPQIAEKIFVSPRTVQSHLRNVFAKLGVATRAELAAEAARRAGSQR